MAIPYQRTPMPARSATPRTPNAAPQSMPQRAPMPARAPAMGGAPAYQGGSPPPQGGGFQQYGAGPSKSNPAGLSTSAAPPPAPRPNLAGVPGMNPGMSQAARFAGPNALGRGAQQMAPGAAGPRARTTATMGNFNVIPGSGVAARANKSQFDKALADDEASWKDEQARLQNQMGAFGREADIMNARMGRSIGGGYASLAGAAMGKGMDAYGRAAQAHTTDRNKLQAAYLDKQLQEKRYQEGLSREDAQRAEERGWAKEDQAAADTRAFEQMYFEQYGEYPSKEAIAQAAVGDMAGAMAMGKENDGKNESPGGFEIPEAKFDDLMRVANSAADEAVVESYIYDYMDRNNGQIPSAATVQDHLDAHNGASPEQIEANQKARKHPNNARKQKKAYHPPAG
jgi:hypothetical protein